MTITVDNDSLWLSLCSDDVLQWYSCSYILLQVAAVDAASAADAVAGGWCLHGDHWSMTKHLMIHQACYAPHPHWPTCIICCYGNCLLLLMLMLLLLLLLLLLLQWVKMFGTALLILAACSRSACHTRCVVPVVRLAGIIRERVRE